MPLYRKVVLMIAVAAALAVFNQMKSLNPFIGEPHTFVLVVSGLVTFVFFGLKRGDRDDSDSGK